MMYTDPFMKLRGLSRFITSALLVAMGSVVMMTSLQSQHVRSTFAATPEFPEQAQSAGSGISRLFDHHMPGALPYLVERGHDRWEIFSTTEEDQPRLLLELALERVQAAEYAFTNGDEKLAFSTLSKSFVYIHRAASLCREQGDQCQASSEQFSVVRDAFFAVCSRVHETAVSSEIRARAQGLCSELEAVLSSFLSTT